MSAIRNLKSDKGERIMGKKFRKLLAIILSIGILATLVAVPMAVSAVPADETYEAYDVIEYADFLDTGDNHLAAEGVTLSAQHTLYHYTVTSATHSAIYKFRWVAGTCSYFQAYPGKYANNNPFQYRINTGASATWQKRYAPGNTAVSVGSAINEGDEFDIEIGRLKVATGENAGKYYSYFKVNGNLIFGVYVDTSYVDAVPDSILDSMQFSLGGTYNCGIKPIPAPAEQEDPDALYYYYDEIDYNDLRYNGNPLSTETSMGGKNFTYAGISNTHSAIIRYRWRAANTSTQFQLSFDRADSVEYMFGVQLYAPGSEGRTNSSIRLRPGLDDANAWVELASDIEDGREYDVEFERLKVKNGVNAGKYYVYFKLDGELISESYVAANVVDGNGNYTSGPGSAACTLSNQIYLTFWGGGGNDKIMHTPMPDVYDDYDEVTYYDFIKNGTSLYSTNPNEYAIGGQKFTYNKTSEYGSAVIKYRWKGANTGSSFYISFDPPPKSSDPSQSATEYTFGVMYSSNTVWLRIGNGDQQPVSPALTMGNDYDIEYGRLKVLGGDNAGKYKLYIRITDVETGDEMYYEEKYIEASVVNANGQYTSNTDGAGSGVICTISNSFYMTFWGNGGGNKIAPIPVPETYDSYDEVNYEDLLINGEPVNALGMDLGSTRRCTYNATSESYSAVLKFRWTAGAEAHIVLYFDEWAGSAYPFCLAIKKPGYSSLGAAAGANGAWHIDPSVAGHIVQMSEPITVGETRDIEYGRLKVMTGPHAGKYYVYLKVDEVLISSYYYDGVSADGTYKNGTGTLSNNVLFTSSTSDNYISSIPEPYEPYDEIEYDDLLSGGNPLSADTTGMSGATVFTYNRTSPTGSAIFKYRWKVGSVAKFQISFEKTSSEAMGYMFGAWLYEPDQSNYPQGKLWLRPSYGPEVNLATALTPGSEHNVEFARLKISTGPDRGKYYVYIKIDNVLIAEDYVAASVVDKNGNYTTNPGSTTCNVKSGEIIFTFWGSEGNAISAYKKAIRGDFDSTDAIDSRDLEALRKAILGFEDENGNPEGIADFNSDGNISVIDLVVMKKHITATNSYSKTGSLNLGTQEHLLESNGTFVDNTKTASYIAAASAALGANTYRLSMAIHDLYYASSSNGVIARDNGKMAQLKGMVAALKAQGINEILYVTDSFILPYGYSNPATNHNKTCPTPGTQDYENWLKVNSAAFGALAAEIPEIKYFEPFNEINLTTTGFEKPGIPWDASDQVAANYKYSVAEKAGIMADLCWYISRAVKAVDPSNQVTTPSICVGSHESIIEGTYLNALYSVIESGTYPTNNALGDIRIDNYFTVINIHAYPEYATTSSARTTKINNSANDIGTYIYNAMTLHNDGNSRVWLTETGVSVFGSRTEANAEDLMTKLLNKINTNMTYVDTVIFYKVADASTSNGLSEPETKFGLFYAGDASSNRYSAKRTAKAVYKFFHNGSTDYTALDNLATNARNGMYSN